MIQNTARLILCLLAGHVLVVITQNNSKAYNKCEPQEFGKCVCKVPEVFQNAQKNQSLVDIYCNSYKAFGQCLTSNAKCVGEIIDLLRFMVHQHMILDKKLGVCPTTDLTPLRKLVQDNEKYRMKIAGLKDLDGDSFEPCTARKNIECVSRYAEHLKERPVDMPTIAKGFYECYVKSNSTVCYDQIYKDYVADVNTAGKILIGFSIDNPGHIPC